MSDDVQIKVCVESLRSRRKVAIDARVYGPLAVHPVIAVSSRECGCVMDHSQFSVTHLRTGYAVVHGLTRSEAVKLVSLLRRAPLSDRFWEGFHTVEAFRSKLDDPLVQRVDQLRKRARDASEREMWSQSAEERSS